MNRLLIPSAVLAICALTGCIEKAAAEKHVYVPPTPVPTPGANEFVVTLTPTKLTREGEFRILPRYSPIYVEPDREELVKGNLDVGNEKVSFYLPKYGPYSNKSKYNHSIKNTSTKISVDSNNNGDLERSEHWWSSLPIRLGDRMFDVKRFDPGGTWILLSKSSAPLAGAVVGKKCPPFTFKTTTGKKVTLADYRGKYLLMDIWSFT